MNKGFTALNMICFKTNFMAGHTAIKEP